MRTINMFDKRTRFQKCIIKLFGLAFCITLNMVSLIITFAIEKNFIFMGIILFLLTIVVLIETLIHINAFLRKINFKGCIIEVCNYRGKNKFDVDKKCISTLKIVELFYPVGRSVISGDKKIKLICITLNGAEPLKDEDEYMSYYKDRNYIFIQVREEIKDIVKEELDIDISEYLQKDKKKHWYEN